MPENYNSIRNGILYLFDPEQTSLTRTFCNELQRRIEDEFDVTVVSDCGEAQTPAVVVCHNHSRLGTDIDSVISKLEVSDQKIHNVAIAVVHAKEKHALPITMPTSTLYDVKYERYGLLVDYAFTPEANIYSCDMNMIADQKMASFLQKYFPRRQRQIQNFFTRSGQMSREKRVVLITLVVVLVLVIIIVLIIVFTRK